LSWWPLAGVALVVLGFALRFNPVLVVVTSGIATGLIAGIAPLALLALIGESFAKGRYLLVLVLMLPVVGLLERNGLREQAEIFIGRLRHATTTRLLVLYLALRQITAAIGLHSIAGHAQTVRPLLAPMAEPGKREKLLALSAATDNVGLFFGEDVFYAFSAVLLMQAFLADNGIEIDPWRIALWGIPTAIGAFVIHALRVHRFARRELRPKDRA
jgi:uncharacterized membrane protein